MSDPYVMQLENLSVELAGRTVIKTLNTAIPSGKLTMLMGHNGAGKSVFLQAIHGLLPLASGTITGPDISATKMVFQRPIMLRRSTAEMFDFITSGYPSIDRQYWLARAGLMHQLHLPAKLLSAGQAQKLFLIAMLATRPRLLLLDEPTAHLDYESTAFIENILTEARAQGLSIIMSSHNRTQVKRLADHVLFFDKGHLVDDQAALAFFRTPASEAAQRWLDFA